MRAMCTVLLAALLAASAAVAGEDDDDPFGRNAFEGDPAGGVPMEGVPD